MPISSPNPLFDHLLESSRLDDSNKWSNEGFDEEIGIMKINFAPYLLFISYTGKFVKGFMAITFLLFVISS